MTVFVVIRQSYEEPGSIVGVYDNEDSAFLHSKTLEEIEKLEPHYTFSFSQYWEVSNHEVLSVYSLQTAARKEEN